jgi:hypothetical protein
MAAGALPVEIADRSASWYLALAPLWHALMKGTGSVS